MMPPTPSMNSVPRVPSMACAAEGDQPRRSRWRGLRGRRRRSGDSGARKRQGAMRSTSSARHRPPERAKQHRRVAGLDHRGVVAAHHRFQRVDRRAGLAQPADQAGGDEGLADVGAGRGDEIGGSIFSAPKSCRARGRRPFDLVVGMLRGKGEAQARGAGRHRGRTDGDGEKAFVLQQRGRRPAPCRLRRSPPARSGFALPAD